MSQNAPQHAEVVGGTIEPDFMFPWVVDVSGTLTGKGVLVAPNWVLTAAHNVETSFGGARISYSRTDPGTGKVTGASQNTAVGSVLLHPLYVTGSPDHDLAMVRLPAPFQPDPFLQPAALPTAAAASGRPERSPASATQRRCPPGAWRYCAARSSLVGGMTFIAQSPTASLCPGDSGSGFVTANGGANVVAGIASQVARRGLSDAEYRVHRSRRVQASRLDQVDRRDLQR